MLQPLRKPPLVIAGSGQVVCSRILPALFERAPDGEHVVHELDGVTVCSPEMPELGRYEQRVLWRKVASESELPVDLAHARAMIVATPSYAHVPYVRAGLAVGLKVAIEKPVTCRSEDLAELSEMTTAPLGSNVFPLSYYVLEKALPLSFICANPERRAAWAPFLELSDDFIALADEGASLADLVGRPRKVVLRLLEGAVRSPSDDGIHWTERSSCGGFLLETFVHVALLARLFAGDSASWLGQWQHRWFRPRYEQLRRDHPALALGSTAARFIGVARDLELELDLEAAKFVAPSHCFRGGTIDFERGQVVCDFDRRQCIVESRHGAFTLNVGGCWANYQIQLRMFSRFIDGRLASATCREALRDQIDTVSWLIRSIPSLPPMSARDFYGSGEDVADR